MLRNSHQRMLKQFFRFRKDQIRIHHHRKRMHKRPDDSNPRSVFARFAVHFQRSLFYHTHSRIRCAQPLSASKQAVRLHEQADLESEAAVGIDPEAEPCRSFFHISAENSGYSVDTVICSRSNIFVWSFGADVQRPIFFARNYHSSLLSVRVWGAISPAEQA